MPNNPTIFPIYWYQTLRFDKKKLSMCLLMYCYCQLQYKYVLTYLIFFLKFLVNCKIKKHQRGDPYKMSNINVVQSF